MENKNTKGQMEMSVGTIVTIVLLVTLLILGVVLIKNIFTSAKGVVDLTDQQLRSQISQLFSSEDKISVYPGTRLVEIKQESTDGVGIGIKNLLTGTAGGVTFSYEVKAVETSNCGISGSDAEKWIITGKSESSIPIASGDIAVDKIIFKIPTGSPLCIAKFRINVNAGGTAYATDSFNIEIKAK